MDAVRTHRDSRAFDVLYDRHTPRLYRLALRLCGGNEPEAEDVVHDAWIRAVARFDQFEWRSAFSTWLGGFAVNCARERTRHRPAHEPLDEVEHANGGDPLPATVDRLDLERAITRLPPGYRHVFVLHDVEGYTHQEIGTLLDIDPGTSKSQLARARRAIRLTLGAR